LRLQLFVSLYFNAINKDIIETYIQTRQFGKYQSDIDDHLAFLQNLNLILFVFKKSRGTAVAQWLRCCATNRKGAGSIPAGVIGIIH